MTTDSEHLLWKRLVSYEFHVDVHGDRNSLKLTADQAMEVITGWLQGTVDIRAGEIHRRSGFPGDFHLAYHSCGCWHQACVDVMAQLIDPFKSDVYDPQRLKKYLDELDERFGQEEDHDE